MLHVRNKTRGRSRHPASQLATSSCSGLRVKKVWPPICCSSRTTWPSKRPASPADVVSIDMRAAPRRGVRHNRLKRNLVVATRFDKLAVRYLATVRRVALAEWLCRPISNSL